MIYSFLRSEDGATLVEYGVALLVAIIVGGTGLIALANQTSTNVTDTTPIVAAR